MAATPTVQFRDAALDAEFLERGGNRNEVARRDLSRYYRLIEREVSALDLSMPEWDALAAATISTAFDDRVTAFVLADTVHDAVRYELLAETWAINGDALERKIAAMRPGEVFAVVDRLEIKRERR